MKRILFLTILAIVTLTMLGCGNGSSHSNPVASILSAPSLDGEVSKDAAGLLPPVQGMSPSVQSVFAGIDPVTGVETRAFLNFPLRGADGVPWNAIIVSATLDIVINSIRPSTGTIPILIDLVSFQPPTLVQTDFERAILLPLASTISRPISAADVGNHVAVDVTELMKEAQRLQHVDFQLRIIENAIFSGIIEINDSTGANSGNVAPLLEVTYF